jgi:hypothetical protein
MSTGTVRSGPRRKDASRQHPDASWVPEQRERGLKPLRLCDAGSLGNPLRRSAAREREMVGSGVCSRSMAAEPADGEVHQVFDETAVERLPVRRLSAALTANSTDAL